MVEIAYSPNRGQSDTPTLFHRAKSRFATYTLALIVALLVVDILVGFLAELNQLDFIFSIAHGLFVGQLSFFVLLFGLRGFNWTQGFLAGCLAILVVSLAGLFGCEIAKWIRFPDAPWDLAAYVEQLTPIFVLPGVMFAAMSPIWLARSWFDWRLERSEHARPRFQSTIGGLLINIVILASLLMTLRGAQVIWGISPLVYWPSCGILGIVFALIFAGLALPLARIVNSKSWRVQFACVLGLAAVNLAFVSSLSNLLEALGSDLFARLSGFPFYKLAISSFVNALILFLGIRAIVADGYELRLNQRSGVPASRSDQRKTHVTVALAVAAAVVAFAANVHVARIMAERRILRDACYAIQEIIGPSGRAGHWDGTFNPIRPELKLIYAEEASDGDIRRIFEILQDANALEELDTLNLDGCKITDASIPTICRATNLTEIDVSRTQVTEASIAGLSKLELAYLYAEELDLTSAAWDQLNAESMCGLTLRGANFSTEALASFLSQPSLDISYLDVSNTSIDEQLKTAIATMAQRQRINRHFYFSDTSMTDEDVEALVGTDLDTLRLDGTRVTDACVDSLAKMGGFYKLDISRTNITDASLPKLLHLGADVIVMVHTKVTAKALLSDPSPGTRKLIVREGQFSPKEIRALRRGGFTIEEEAEARLDQDSI